MNGEEKTIAVATVAVALVLVALVGGCTYGFRHNNTAPLLRACIDSGYEWINGDCVRRELKGGDA